MRRSPVGRAAAGATAVCLAALLLGLLGPRTARGEGIVTASGDRHAWFVREVTGERTRIELCHLDGDADGAKAQAFLVLSGRPEAMAAFGGRLWIVFPPDDADPPRRSVFSLDVIYNEGLDVFYTEPRERLNLEPPLPGTGALAGLVGTSSGPVALIDDPAGPSLRALGRNGWEAAAVPPDLPRGPLRLGSAGTTGATLLLLAGRPPDGAMLTREADGTWQRQALPVDPATVRAVVRVGALPLVLADDGPDRLRPGFLRRAGLLPLASFTRPADAWGYLGLDGGPALVERIGTGRYELVRFDAASGAERTRDPVRIELTSGRMWAFALLFAVTVTAMMLLLFLRPAPVTISLPPSLGVARMGRRAAALVIDLVPAAAVTVLLLRCEPASLLNLPLLTADVLATVPYFVMAGFTLLHTSLVEVIAGRSLGKRLTGLRLVTPDGARPTARRLVIRSLVAAVLFIIPPLVVLILLNPHGQGLHDQFGRTLVVRPLPGPPAEGGSGPGESVKPGAGQDR